jgi:hypothetical protein
MKKTILSLLVAVGLIVSASASVLTGSLTNGLVAYYGFNGSGNDLSGNGNDINTLGYSFVSDQNGVPESAIYFNYGNPLSIPNSQNWSLNNFTYSLWIQPDGTFNHWLMPTGQRADYSMGANTWGIGAIFNNSPYTINGWQAGGTFSYTGYNASYSSSSNLNNIWQMLTVVQNNGLISLYFNGNIAATASYSGTMMSSTQPVYIGSSGYKTDQTGSGSFSGTNDVGQSYQGAISDYAVYNRALSSAEVSQLYTAQSVPEPSAYALFGIGAIGMLMVIRRKKTA